MNDDIRNTADLIGTLLVLLGTLAAAAGLWLCLPVPEALIADGTLAAVLGGGLCVLAARHKQL